MDSSILCLFALISIISLFNPSACYNHSATLAAWAPARATWYGPPEGAGTDGGACGYGSAVLSRPFNKMIAAGGPSLFQSGKGCGTCYQVSCNGVPECSGNPVTVTITDNCSGGPCASDAVHFDLSGAAFGAMAKPGQANQLRNAGSIAIRYSRVPCKYPGFHVAFKVDQGSNPYYFATVVEYESRDGDLVAVDLMQAGSNAWQPMSQSWGVVWQLNAGYTLKAPFSIRVTSRESRRKVVAVNVIPVGWKPGATYMSHVS